MVLRNSQGKKLRSIIAHNWVNLPWQ